MGGFNGIRKDDADVRESEIMSVSPDLLDILLSDRTTGKNIFWATDDYSSKGLGYGYKDEITREKITGDNECLIMPRVLKRKEVRQSRVRERAEVFTPSWICNVQNNRVDAAWFGRDNVFNEEAAQSGVHKWITSTDKVAFPKGKTWKSYIKTTVLEITCGEAPYLVSRYDTTTGDYLPVRQRIGLLDRKLRVVGENTVSPEEWMEWAIIAYQNTYGYEWQGDNLLLARENLLQTFIDFYADKFSAAPSLAHLETIAIIISWNLWQMDGLKGVVPDSCHDMEQTGFLFDGGGCKKVRCPGCENNDMKRHNGLYCNVMDWEKGMPTRYLSLLGI